VNTSRLGSWILKKTMVSVFYWNNKEAKRQLKISYNDETMPFCSKPKFLGITLERTLAYYRHLESLCKKLTPCIAVLEVVWNSWWWNSWMAAQHMYRDLVQLVDKNSLKRVDKNSLKRFWCYDSIQFTREQEKEKCLIFRFDDKTYAR